MAEYRFKPGEVVGGKYRLEKLLGEGAMGTVWAARNERTDRAFAVKFMLARYSKDPTLVQRFLNEARVCGRLDHPSLIEIYDLGVADEFGGAPFLVMELLRGEGLDKMLDRVGKLEPVRICPIIIELASALSLAHEAGVVHRDIKPANIFLHRSRKGELVPKLLDFGVSKGPSEDTESMALTRAGTVLGSPLYMSPEQARGQADIDARADVWGLGVMLYQALSGRLPFNENNYNAVLSAILTHRHRPLREVAPDCPQELSDLIDQCLVKDRNRRLANAGALAERLERILLACLPEAPVAPALERVSVPNPFADAEATEVMTQDTMPAELLHARLAAGLSPAVPQLAEAHGEPMSMRSQVLRRQWLTELAGVVNTAKYDDIRQEDSVISEFTERAQRVQRVERQLAEVEDAAEGTPSETQRAIREARLELLRGKPDSRPSFSSLTAAVQPKPPKQQRLLLMLLGVLLLVLGLGAVALRRSQPLNRRPLASPADAGEAR